MSDPDLLIPKSLLADPDRFGGVAENDCLRGAAQWHDGRLVGLSAPRPGREARLVIPRLADAHCHLDKCHTLPRLGLVGGDLTAAIDASKADKANWTETDLKTRATRGLQEYAQAFTTDLRSHIDWGDSPEPPLAWHVLTEMDTPHVQWAALTGIDRMADATFAEQVAGSVARTAGGVLGSFILHHDPADIRAGLRNVFALADRHGLMLDFHVDESLEHYNGLEEIADMALHTGFQGPILCGHAVTLMNRNSVDLKRIADKLVRAGITICALPTTNLYLQGRSDGTPDRRGITRMRELYDAGVAVIVGSDNVADAFCPIGAHDPMAALHLAILTGHLDAPFGRWLPMVTTAARTAMGLAPTPIDGARKDDLLVSTAHDIAGLVSGRASLKGV